MKIINTKALFPVLLLLILGVVTGCQKPVQQTGKASGDLTADKESDQTSGDQPKATEDATDQTATEDAQNDSAASAESTAEPKQDAEAPAKPTIDIPSTWKRLTETQEVWIDTTNKQVIVGGKVCLTQGPLEMLICPLHTKEHETIVAVNAESWQVHAGLVAIGAAPGAPSSWHPEYVPAWGPKIDIKMMWRDEKTKEVKKIDGKQWVLNGDTQKPMTAELVFGGSRTEPMLEGDKPRYQADDGELICLANFSTSTIDLSVSEENIDLFFEANTPLIPPVNTQVYTVITPGPVVGKPKEE